MFVTEMSFADARPVQGYGPGFFRIDGRVIEGPLLATAKRAALWAGPDDPGALTALAGEIDVVIFGQGGAMAPLDKTLEAAMLKAAIGIEHMATPTACRTFNVLLSEGRRIALAALPV